MPLSLFLLGPPRVEIDGEVVNFPRQKSLALLAYLAVTGEQQRRDTLAALLWPESADARGSLRRELSSLKAALGDGDWLDAERESVSLAGDFRLDVEDFLHAAHSDDPARLAQAADFYRGDFLTGFSLADAPEFDDWRFFQAEEYRRRLAAALELLIAHHQPVGDPAAAIPYARRLLALDNLHEPAHRILMRVYALAGQHAAALRQYDECVRILDEELGAPPEEETTALRDAIRTRRVGGQVASGRSHVASNAHPNPPIPNPQSPVSNHNLPSQVTPFVGRGAEVRAVVEMLRRGDSRLVTITGPGGMGKTRLGLAVAEALLPDFPDGVWFVPLATLETPEALPRAMAAALSAPVGGADARGPLFAFLHPKRLLLLLDNFEHLLEGADFLAELLPHAPGVKLLVTSQERLNLLEESIYPLGGLSLESDGAVSSALNLFEQTARRVQPDFSLAKEKADVTAICQAVEGMPLAIELAAGWVRVMSCATIAAEIQRSVDFLSTTLRNLPARHRSLRAVFERSWVLLSTEQQSVLQRLAVFRGGFDRPAALAVAGATPHVLIALLDHSFIRRQAGNRFDMHGLMQHFAYEKLANEPGVIDKCRQAHTDYYAELLNSMPWEYNRPEEVVGIWRTRDDAHAHIALNFPNVQVAWRWAVQCEDVDSVRKMMNALVDCLQLTDLMGVGRDMLDSSIAAFESSGRLSEKTRVALVGQLLLKRALIMRHDELEARHQLLVRSLSLLRQNPDAHPIDIAHAIEIRGSTLSDLGQKAAAEKDLYEALALFRAADHSNAVSHMILLFGQLQWGWGELKTATISLREAAERFTDTDDEARHRALQALAAVNLLQGNYAEAGRILDRCASYYRQLPQAHLWSTYIIQNYGELATATGRFADAERYFSAALEQFERVGKAWQNQLVGYLTPGVLLRLQGKLAESENYLEKALITAREVGWKQMEPFVLHHLSRVQVEKGEYHRGLQLAEEALSISRSISQRFGATAALCQMGHCQIALKQPDAARAAYAEALKIADAEGIDRLICDALTGIARLLLWQGDRQLAASILHFAHTAEASEWETKRRAERLLAELPPAETRTQIPSLEEAIRLVRAALDDKMTGRQDDTHTSSGHPVTPSPGHLPTPTTSFIGRENELAELSALLARPDVRLVTVVAPGGMGKTRFAIEAARRLAADYPDGVWFLSLVGVSEASQMLAALVQLLDAPMGAGGAKEAILRFLARRRLLLMLDNFEQLAAHAEILAEIVQGAPGVKVLVTSRVRLNLREEWAFPLDGLAVGALLAAPVADVAGAASSAPTNDAIRLFIERAQQMQPHFNLASEAASVAAICRVVEGMPLGIELAASWLRAMKCAEIAVEIRRDVDFLSTPLRNVPAQHRSMRAVFERSWGLLTPEEQRGLARLSVFQGGFTRQAAEAVADARLPLLSALVDHSLLRHSASGRYDIHELLRQFAAERLDASDEAKTVRDKHADYFLGFLAERMLQQLDLVERKELAEGFTALNLERENLFAGWRWATQRHLFAQIRAAAYPLLEYCSITDALESGSLLFAQAVTAVEEAHDTVEDRPGLLGMLHWMQIRLGHEHNQPEIRLQQFLRVHTLLTQSESKDTTSLGYVGGTIGLTLATLGKNQEGVVWIEKAIQAFTEIQDFWGVGYTYGKLADLRTGEGKLHLANEAFDKANEWWQRATPPYQNEVARRIVFQMQGNYLEQRRVLQQAKESEQGNEMRRGTWLRSLEDHLGEAAVALGRLDEATTHFERVRAISEIRGEPWAVTLGFKYAPGTVLRLQGNMEAARRQIEWELATVRSAGFKQRIAARLHELARLEYDEGRYAASEAALTEALAITQSIGFLYGEAFVLCQMGHTAAAQGKPEASGFYRRALEIATEQGMNGIVVDVLLGVGQVCALAGKDAEAAKLLAVVATHSNSDWETKRRAERLLAERFPETTHGPIPSLVGAVHIARTALDDKMTGRQDDTHTSSGHPVTPSPGHLPTPTTSFIGRENELAELCALLARPDVRLVTVVATGGMGKTRFAIEAARRLAADYPDGVWFLPLVGVSEASQMLAALVQLLDAPMGAGGAKDAILRFLARRRLLLVLDNFEQLVDSADVLAEIVQGAPEVEVLVTTRVRLNLREEWAFPLDGLAVGALLAAPVADVAGAASSAPTNDAIRLFIERARQIQPNFDPKAEAESVAAICRAVEGMPLGIELAASWLRAMNCDKIAAEIRRDMDFLSTPLRNVPAQHRSMRAVFERSWGLLTPEEQRGLARLSVFQGGFTRQAAEAVADVRLPLLSALVDHSLLRHSASGRYDVHELLRQFAAEQLDASAEAEAIHDKHADYFLHLLSQRREDLAWRAMEPALAKLIPERENLFAGWGWASQRGLFALIREAATILPLYCNLTNAQESGWQLFAQAIAAVEEKATAADDRASLLGILRFRQQVELQHSHNQPEAYLQRLLETRELLLASKSDNREELARLGGAIGIQVATVGRGEEGATWMEDAIRTFQETGNYFEMGKIFYRFALLRTGEGKVRLADETFGKVAEAWQRAKLPSYPIVFRGMVYHMQGRYAEMYQLWEKGQEIGDDPFVRGFSSMGGPATIEKNLAEASVALGALDEAATHFQRAQASFEAQGSRWPIVHGFQFSPGTVLRLQGQMEAARRQIEWEVATVRSTGFDQRIATRLLELARLEYDEGKYAASEAALSEALAIAESIDFRFIVALVLCQMGHTAAAQGKPDAPDYYRRALEIAAEEGMNGIIVDVLQGVAGLASQTGDVAQAVEWLALAASHPNAEWETKQKAEKALAKLEGQLSAEEFSAAREQGRVADLETILPTVLAWLV